MGRIRRVSVVDATENYTLEETSAYDANDPAATTAPWPSDAAADQDFDEAAPLTVAAEGVLVTFVRFPDAFLGAMVKIEPDFDFDAGEAPAIELWTHDSVTLAWTKLRRIDLTNVFVGAPSGSRRIMDLTFFPFLRTVDQVWITMDPGAVGTPTLEWLSIQLFGQCEQTLRRDSGLEPEGACENPNSPFYTGFDDNGFPCPGTEFKPPNFPPLPEVDICNPASIEQYRNAISEIPGALEVFDAWRDLYHNEIELFCSGIQATPPGGGVPIPPIPPLPALDLCDEDSIDAFRAAVAGDADNLAAFDAFIEALEDVGFFDFVCMPPDPPEQYINPETLEEEDEPTEEEAEEAPFGAGPGGLPQFPRQGNTTSDGGGDEPITVTTYNAIFAKPRGTVVDDYVFCQTVDGSCNFTDICGSLSAWETDIRTRFTSGAIGSFGTLFVDQVAPSAPITEFPLLQSSTMKMRFSGFLAHADVTIEVGVITQGGVQPGFVTIGSQLVSSPDYAGQAPGVNADLYKLSFTDVTTGFDYVMEFGSGLDVPTVCGDTFFIQAVVFRIVITQQGAVDNLRVVVE